MGTDHPIEPGQIWAANNPAAPELAITVIRPVSGADMWIVRREPRGNEYPMSPAAIRANYTLTPPDDPGAVP